MDPNLKSLINAKMQQFAGRLPDGGNRAEEMSPAPDGTYRCLTEGRYVEPAQGKPYLGLKHSVIVGDFIGKNFYQDVYVTPDSLFYGYPHFKALGLLSFEAISDANIADWVCDITVKTETTRSGKTRQVVINLVVVERRETTDQKAAEPVAQ